uniref:Centromere protein J C-terminal domain-containing protein n=1 Tax=Trichuris muris TaxID=70415 RepID=A0A5S6QMG6_TRIMR
MSGPAPFPFLRRGDGMKKYSKVQYPTYKRANNRATTDHVDLDRVTSLSSAVDSPAQENNTGNSLSFAVSSPSTSCLQAMENIEVKQFELLEKLAQELSLSDSSAYVRLLNGVCMPGGLETTSENAAGQLPNEFHDVPSSSASPLRTVNQPLDDRASLNQLNSNTMSERSLEGLKSSSNMQTAFKFAWDQQNGKAAKSLPKQPLEPTAVQPSISTADDSIAMQKRLECMVEQLEMDAQEVENVQTILAKKSTLLESEKLQLEKEKADFKKEKEEHMKIINNERQFLRQQQKATHKKDTDVIAVLKQQISDLQNEICDKEARCSGLRSRIRTLESELNSCKGDLTRWREKHSHLEETNVRLDQENTLLRLKLRNVRNGEPAPDAEATALLVHDKVKGIQRSSLAKKSYTKAPTDKSVRFLLPDEESHFVRTENRAVQTDLDRLRQLPTVVPSVIVHEEYNSLNNPADECNTDTMRPPSKTFERVRADGSVESVYANGTVQEVSADGQIVTYHYSNGDSRRFLPDGSEVYLFRYGRMETHHLDGRIEIEFPKNSSSMTVFPDGRQSRRFADGTVAERDLDGTETFSFKDGSKEIRHKDYVRRDFPNGDVKFKHADGTEETRYANGRLRVKDPNGKVIRDEVIARR